MSNITDKPVCHRADDMISFMYIETDQTEATDFSRHLETCAACRSELALLSRARESMSQWRSAVLGATWQAGAAADTRSPLLERKPARRLSALAALREFFAISPLWLRGATAMAAIMFCLLVGLLGSRMLRTPQQLFTRDEVNAQVQRQVDQLRRESQRPNLSESGPRQEVVAVDQSSQVEPASFPKPVRRRIAGKTSRRFLTREEREQLAADLRLQPTTDEDDLSSLLDGGSN